MNRSLKDINKSLSESKTKMKSDLERSLRGLNFGKLYLKNGEFDKAFDCVNTYLGVRPNSSEGHKLLGLIYEAIGEDEKAVMNYRKALELKKGLNENYFPLNDSQLNTSFDSSKVNFNKMIENNSQLSSNSTPERRETTPENSQSGGHTCGTCSNQSVLYQMVKQQESLIETNKVILDLLKQNNHNINDIQQQLSSVNESICNLNDSQNALKDTIYEYMTQEEHEDFDDYILDKENENLDSNGLFGLNISQTLSSGLSITDTSLHNKPLSELFKPPPNSWTCLSCYVQNEGSRTKCSSCETDKPGLSPNLSAPEPANNTFDVTNVEPFSFKPSMTSSTSGFKFGFNDLNSNLGTNSIFSKSTFTFGNTLSNETLPTFGSNSPKFSVESKPIDNISNNYTIEDDENVSNADIYFKPLIPLPDLVEVQTGEEEETPIYCQRAKLYRYDINTKEWKERGIGDFKILKHKTKVRYRMILRREQILKIACNHYISPLMKLNPMNNSETAICWNAIDFADGNQVEEQFALKLKNKELLEEFIGIFNDCKTKLEEIKESKENENLDSMIGQTESSGLSITDTSLHNKPLSELFKPPPNSWTCLSCYVQNEGSRTKCSACETDKPGLSPNLSAPEPANNTFDVTNVEPFSFKPSMTSSTSGFKFGFNDLNSNLGSNSIFSKSTFTFGNTLSNETLPTFGSQSKPIDKNKDEDIEIIYVKIPESEEIIKKAKHFKLPLNFYDYENKEPCKGCRGCRDDDLPLQSTSMTTNLLNETSNPIKDSLFRSMIAESNISETNWQTNSSAKHVWMSTTPAPLFSSNNTTEDDENAVSNTDIYFKPLIPLPDLVEVQTGEEEETPIYCQRAKLYRYDINIKEWKERGIGDFKILKHKTKVRYRMILRRDQILKIACNHYISPLMKLNPMNTSETAICWNVIDFTDGNATEEQFALKFKNKQLLQNFIEVFNECKAKLEEIKDSETSNENISGTEDTDAEEDQQN